MRRARLSLGALLFGGAAVGAALLLTAPAALAETEEETEAAAESADEDDAQAAATPAATQSTGSIDEIVTFAQKREASLQNTAVAVTAFNQQAIRDLGIAKATDLTNFTPNFTVRPGADGNNFLISQRGVSQADTGNIMTSHGTGVYVDGVYHTFTIGSLLEVTDLEQAEVLRGPQGSLWGRNTAAGAVNFITRKPKDEWGAEFELIAGNYANVDAHVRFNVPILGGEGMEVAPGLGVLASSFSFSSLNRDAFYGNNARQLNPAIFAVDPFTSGGRDSDEENRLSGRISVRWLFDDFIVGDRFTLDYSWDRHHVNEASQEQQLTYLDTSSPFFNGATTGLGFGVDLRPYVSDSRKGHIDANRAVKDQIDQSGHALTMALDFDDTAFGNLTVKSITAYRELDNDIYADRDGSPFEIFSNREITDHEQWTQEINFIGDSPLLAGEKDLGHLDYVVGYFFFWEDASEIVDQNSFFDPAFDNVIIPNPVPPPPVFILDIETWSQVQPKLETNSHAVFTHLGYTPPVLDDALKFEFGIRYTYDDKDAATGRLTGDRNAPMDDPLIPIGTKSSKSFDEITPSGRISYRFTEDCLEGTFFDNVLTYASVAKGFNSGVFNARAFSANQFDMPVKEETVVSYELGFKIQAFDRRLVFNAAGYYMDYTDMHRTFLATSGNTVGSGLRNAGEAELAGTELELIAMPTDNLVLNASYGYTFANYLEYIECSADALAASGGAPSDCTDVIDNPGLKIDRSDDVTVGASSFEQYRFGNVPKHTFNVGGEYTLDIFDFMLIRARLDYYWQSSVLLQTGINPNAKAGAFGTLAARLVLDDIAFGGGLLDLSFWGRNLLDREYREFGIDFETSSAGNFPYVLYGFGAPRTLGADIRWTF